ncbi:DUF2461 domain-containing protein [Panacibacter ginsenosidivorans]|uniref:DUF2461 domain-containing protein n=1 Tax=Panacibacter ginsenosidivorans TaxID=1813871 RepID=A0A5B8VBZ1_9BACT|nr:DUF2461 domain-containing protein [Panacibacter ginsenosidivorans]QEC68451.1 DUF2461 domain-containing protein [Panacibacter ginsenosidivorans]
MLQPATIKFLKDLKKNNTKEWFDKNRKLYEAAKADFAEIVQSAIDKFGKKDETIATLIAKDCMFRINRDVRFSKDKSPYKTNMGASINKAGKKAWNTAGYYFHLEPGGSFVGGGLYMPEPGILKKVRQEIDYNFNDFKKIIGNKKFAFTYKDLDHSSEMKLSRPPKDYEAENPAIEYIKLKSFIAMAPITDTELTDKNLVKKIADAFEALQPLINFLNHAIEE